MSDDYTLNDDGTIIFELEHITRVLRRPTLGQYRVAMEGLANLRQQTLSVNEGGDPEDPSLKIQFDVFIAWLDEVFQSLAGEGLPRTAEGAIDEDKLPGWIVSNQVVLDLVRHWQSVPSRRGGR